MEWAEYKLLCDQPNFMSRNLIETTAELVDDLGERALCLSLRASIEGAAGLERPADHRGDDRSHMFEVLFSGNQVDRVLQVLEEAQRKAAGGSITSSLAGIHAAWLEYQQWLGKR